MSYEKSYKYEDGYLKLKASVDSDQDGKASAEFEVKLDASEVVDELLRSFGKPELAEKVAPYVNQVKGFVEVLRQAKK